MYNVNENFPTSSDNNFSYTKDINIQARVFLSHHYGRKDGGSYTEIIAYIWKDDRKVQRN